MEEKKYKLLQDYTDFLKDDVITAEEVGGEEEVVALLEEGVLELVVEAPEPAPVVEDAKPAESKPEDEELVEYKVLTPIAITDGQGGIQGHYRVGQTVKFPRAVGTHYVEKGLAEEVVA